MRKAISILLLFSLTMGCYTTKYRAQDNGVVLLQKSVRVHVVGREAPIEGIVTRVTADSIYVNHRQIARSDIEQIEILERRLSVVKTAGAVVLVPVVIVVAVVAMAVIAYEGATSP